MWGYDFSPSPVLSRTNTPILHRQASLSTDNRGLSTGRRASGKNRTRQPPLNVALLFGDSRAHMWINPALRIGIGGRVALSDALSLSKCFRRRAYREVPTGGDHHAARIILVTGGLDTADIHRLLDHRSNHETIRNPQSQILYRTFSRNLRLAFHRICTIENLSK